MDKQFQKVSQHLADVHEAIDELGDPATEFLLKSTCGNSSKATYQLRLTGDILSESALESFSSVLRDSLGNTLEGSIDDAVWEQSQLQVKLGGLGYKTPEDVALPAFLASG